MRFSSYSQSRPIITVLALCVAAAFGGFAATLMRDAPQTAQASAPATVATVPALAALPTAVNGQALPSLAPMLQRVMPAVVSVHSKQRVQVSPFGNDPFFRRMFPELSQERIAESLGSGVIVDAAQGLVLTNHHVIEGADDVSVTLADGRTLRAQFIGSDADTDVALMQIPAENLTAIPMADSNQLQVGDFVVAIGNPFGVGQTVTSGIVSAVGRSNVPGIGFQNFIQTDASINPGNSGGALVDLQGRLVGINTASFNPRGSQAGNIGLGFAIPVNLARNIQQQLLTTGSVQRGTLGVDLQNVDAQIARGLGLDEARGALITRVHQGSAAQAAGLQAGDVVLAVNGQRIDNAESFRNFQGLQAVGSPLILDIRRDGAQLQLRATLQALARSGADFDVRLGGATLTDLPESLRRQGISGVLVERIERNSRAANNGLRQGDVIIAANAGRFNDVSGFRSILQNAQAQQLVLRVVRGGRQGDIILR